MRENEPMKRMRKASFEQMAEDVWKGASLGSEGNPQEPVKTIVLYFKELAAKTSVDTGIPSTCI